MNKVIARVGVYGTLKKGYRANALLKPPTSTLKKEGFFKIPYKLCKSDIYTYPALFKDETENDVYLEIYDIHSEGVLENLDFYEGYPYLYNKDIISIDGDDVILYVMENAPDSYNPIKIDSGKWESQ